MYKNYNITTSICVDQDSSGNQVNYTTLGGRVSKDERKNIYWKCVFTFFATSTKVNPIRRHVLFTNDNQDVKIEGVNIRGALKELGVEIIFLPFNEFDPVERSKSLRNAFYKMEVIKRLGQEKEPSILLDSDCLFQKHSNELDKLMLETSAVLLQDTYQRSEDPQSKTPHHLSMVDMGNLFQMLEQSYPNKAPIWYGGEVIGANPENFQKIGLELQSIFTKIMQLPEKDRKVVFANGQSMFDNDEFVTSFVYNKLPITIIDIHGTVIRRIWTWDDFFRVKPKDNELPIWHLPAEKRRGLDLLFKELVKRESPFWNLVDISSFVGAYVGIPERKIFRKKTLGERLKSTLLLFKKFLKTNQ